MSRDNFSRRYSVVADTRRQWSDAEKRSIVTEASRPGVNISAVARRHGIKPSLLFRWRRLAREAQDGAREAVFVPVTLALPPPGEDAPVPRGGPTHSSSAQAPCPAAETARHCAGDRIEIELGNGRLVRVGAGVDTETLKRIVDLLDQPDTSSGAPDRKQKP
jgi:transposase